MDVYLVQHGEALSEEQDPERPLSEEGRKAVAKVARYVAALSRAFLDPPPSQIWHSGKLRAEQTAEILARALAPNVTPAPHRGMKPKDDPKVICDELTAARDRSGAILLVGHLPHLARLVGLLLAEDVEKKVIDFVNAGVVKLRPAESGWTLAGYITPSCVR
jgi:phosphohistidine phosphatase